MALYGKLDVYVVNRTTGLPVNGAAVEIRRQGATANGTTGPNTVTVHDPGGVLVGHDVQAGLSGDTRTITSQTITTIVNSGLGWGTVADLTRMTVVSSLPTTYNDEHGDSTKTNALTTDADGHAWCYLPGGIYDIKISGAGITSELWIDQAVTPAGLFLSNFYPGSSGAAWDFDTGRALSGSDLLFAFRNNTALKISGRQDGLITCVGLTSSAVITISAGGLTVTAGGITVTAGGVTINGGGLTMGAAGGNITVNQTSGTNEIKSRVKVTSQDVELRHLVAGQGTAMTTGDITLGANWGAGAVVTSVTNAKNTAGRVRITSGAAPAGTADFTVTFKDGGFSSNPHVLVCRAGGTINVTVGMVLLITVNTNNFTVSVAGNLAATTAYDYEWFVVATS